MLPATGSGRCHTTNVLSSLREEAVKVKTRGPFFRLSFEPRDIWVGVYWNGWENDGSWRDEHFDVYVTIIPMLPLRLRWWRP